MYPSLLDIFTKEGEQEAWALYSAQLRAGLIQEPAVRIPVGTKINRAAQLGIEDDCTGRVMPRYLGGDIAYTTIEVVDTKLIGGCMEADRFHPRERIYLCLVDEEREAILDENLAMRIFAPDAQPQMIAKEGQIPILISGIRKAYLTIDYAGRRDGIPWEYSREVYASVRHLKPYDAVYVLKFGSVLAGAVDEQGLAALLANPCRALVQVNCEWGYPLVTLRLCDESLKLRLTSLGSGCFLDDAHKELLAYSKGHNQLVTNGSFQLGDARWHIVMGIRVGQLGKELHIWREDGGSAWIPANVIDERLNRKEVAR